MVDLAKKYAEERLDPETKGYLLHNRKKFISFSAYDLEEAFEEGQSNPIWNYNKEPEIGMTYLVFDNYIGYTEAIYDGENWKSEDDLLIGVEKWIKIPI